MTKSIQAAPQAAGIAAPSYTIKDAAADSDEIRLFSMKSVVLYLPSTSKLTSIDVWAANKDSGTFHPLIDGSGNPVTVAFVVGANGIAIVLPEAVKSCNVIKLQGTFSSGDSESITYTLKTE